MKRSEINRALRELEAMVAEYRFSLPPFCRFTPEEWADKGHEYDEIRHNMLGWDITDYGLGTNTPRPTPKSCCFSRRGSIPPTTSTGTRWRISSTGAAARC